MAERVSERVELGEGQALVVEVDVATGLAALEVEAGGAPARRLEGLLPQHVLDLSCSLSALAKRAGALRAAWERSHPPEGSRAAARRAASAAGQHAVDSRGRVVKL